MDKELSRKEMEDYFAKLEYGWLATTYVEKEDVYSCELCINKEKISNSKTWHFIAKTETQAMSMAIKMIEKWGGGE